MFCNYAVTYSTKVLIPIKLVLKRVQEILPFTGVGLGWVHGMGKTEAVCITSQGVLAYPEPLLGPYVTAWGSGSYDRIFLTA